MTHAQHLLERGPDPFDAAVHPRAVRQRPLVADPQPLQGEGEDPGREDRFVVGTDCLRLAVVFDGIQQQAEDGDGCAIEERVQRQHTPATVIEDAQQWLLRLWFDAMLGQVDGPDSIHCAGTDNGVRMPLRRGSPLLVLAQELRHVGLAD